MATSLCGANRCRSAFDLSGPRRRRQRSGMTLCATCRDALGRELSALPGFYATAERSARSRSVGSRVDKVSADVRSRTLAALASWSARFSSSTAVGDVSPGIGAVVACLVASLDRLADTGPALAEVVETAYEALHPNPMHRVEMGVCHLDGCERVMFATVRTAHEFEPLRLSCAAGHVWPPSRSSVTGRLSAAPAVIGRFGQASAA